MYIIECLSLYVRLSIVANCPKTLASNVRTLLQFYLFLFAVCGEPESLHSETVNDPLYQSRMMDKIGRVFVGMLAGRRSRNTERTCSSATLSTINPTLTDLGLNARRPVNTIPPEI
jgi:hypothetical protein